MTKQEERAPAFQFYWKQWLADDKVMAMSWAARAMHMHFICIAWQQHPACTLPDDDDLLQAWVGFPADWPALKKQILRAWRLDEETGRWVQDGLLRVWQQQLAYRESRQKNASKRKGAHAEHMHPSPTPSPSPKKTTSRKRVADEVPDGPPTSPTAPPKVPAGRETWLSPYLGAYREHYGVDIAAPGQAAGYLRPSHEELGPVENLARWKRYLVATPLDKVSTKRYSETHPAYAATPSAAVLGARASPRTAEDAHAERKLRFGKVEGRKNQRDGEDWWTRVQKEAHQNGITNVGEVYDYAYKQLAS